MAPKRRWRVRTMARTWDDPGPDLLQIRQVAQSDLAKTMGTARDGWFVRIGEHAWSRHPSTKAEALQRYTAWQQHSGDGAEFHLGRKHKGKVESRIGSRCVFVPHHPVANVNPGANLVADMARAHFAGLNVGGFSCREYNGIPGSGWSDHAWGDAVDLVLGGGDVNDRLTDWCVRMARTGGMEHVAQFIGSRDGHVGTFYAPGYVWNAGGPESHLTHVHASYRQHFGLNPHCS